MNRTTALRLSALLTVLAMAIGFAPTSASASDDTENDYIMFDKVYAGATYAVQDLTDVPVEDMTLVSDKSKVFWDGDVLKIKVHSWDDMLMDAEVLVNDEWVEAYLPVYKTAKAKTKKLRGPARIQLTNRYPDPVVVKCRGYHRPGYRHEFTTTIEGLQTKSKRVHYEEQDCYLWVMAYEQKIFLTRWTTLGFNVKAD